MLQVDGLHAAYGKSQVLNGVSLAVHAGEIVSVLGRNGMGKTTTLRAITGLLRPQAGSVRFMDEDLALVPVDEIARRGISLVPSHRGIFTLLSVQENLQIAWRRGATWTVERVYDAFPRLRERRRNLGGALSGGEQQLLAIARALVQGPKLLLLDEPTEGLAPVIVEEVVRLVAEIGASGIPIVLVEQNFEVCKILAARHYILEEGRIVFEGSGEVLAADVSILDRFLGVNVDRH